MSSGWADWLTLISNLSGLGGTVLIAKPFFRENRLKKLLHDLRGVVLGSGGAKEVIEAARAKAEKKKNRWQSSDYMAVVFGIMLVGLSYMLNIVLWFLPRVSMGS